MVENLWRGGGGVVVVERRTLSGFFSPLLVDLLFYRFSTSIHATHTISSLVSCSSEALFPFRSARPKMIPCISNVGKTK